MGTSTGGGGGGGGVHSYILVLPIDIYLYLDCLQLLCVKMRGHKMAETWGWLLMGSAADQYHDQACRRFDLFWYTAFKCRLFWFWRPKFPYFTVVFFILLYSYYMVRSLRFFTIIYLLASCCKWFYWTKVDQRFAFRSLQPSEQTCIEQTCVNRQYKQ